ncbi:hypothetical protein QD461_11010 [Rhizobium sp. BR 314]
MSFSNRQLSLKGVIVYQPPAFPEKTGRQADGRVGDFFGRFVHAAIVVRVFAENVQTARSNSGNCTQR